MQQLLDCCDQYALEHDLVYNGSKSVCMLFRPKGHNCPVADLYLSNGNLQYVNSHKYLGVILEDGNCDKDITRQLKRFHINANLLIWKMYFE